MDDEEEEEFQPVTPFSLLARGTCSFCRWNLKFWNKTAKAELFQSLAETFFDNMCYVGRFSLYLNSCKGFSRHYVPGLLDNLSEIVLTPDYMCPLMGFCEANPSYEPMIAGDYIE